MADIGKRTRRRSTLSFALLCVAAAAGGCARGHPSGGPSAATPIIVTVSNGGTLDADISAAGSGGQYHLGRVPVDATATLYLPAYVVSTGTVRVFVQPVDGDRWWTPTLHVEPGSSVVLELSSPIQQSTLRVDPPN
jgi:hypothetical protein